MMTRFNSSHVRVEDPTWKIGKDGKRSRLLPSDVTSPLESLLSEDSLLAVKCLRYPYAKKTTKTSK
jgi:hypothetical protein